MRATTDINQRLQNSHVPLVSVFVPVLDNATCGGD
jgi:hypothetical protein